MVELGIPGGHMRPFFLVALVVSLCGCSHILFEERHKCARWIPVLRELPAEREYRILRVLQEANDYDMAYQACAEGADAVVSTLAGEWETTGRATAGIAGNVAIARGKTTTEENIVLRGIAIKWVQ
jgi:hypothetical protein